MIWNRTFKDSAEYVAEHGFNIGGALYSFDDCMSLANVASGVLVPDRLANHPDLRVRLALAPKADTVVTKYLMEDPANEVRTAAMANPSVSPRDLETMGHRTSVASRVAAASHPRVCEAKSYNVTSGGHLSVLLAKDEDVNVRCALAANPFVAAYDQAVIMALSWDDEPEVRAAAAANPSTPADLLTDLADDDCFAPRQAAFHNPSTPESAREPLMVEFAC